MPKKPKAKPTTKTPEPPDAPSEDSVVTEPEPTKAVPSARPAAKKTEPTLPEATVVKSEKPKASSKKMWWWIGGGVAGLLLVAALGYVVFGPNTTPAPANIVNRNTNDTASPQSVRAIDGVYVEAGNENPNLYAVMIENLTSSRPPSGLDKASLVYEALAEGGITRFMAIYPVGTDVPEIGPVRSARLYYIPYAEELNRALYVHVGGSPQAISYLASSQSNVIDFNQFRYSPNFWRDSARSAPHNLYTSTEKLFLGLKKIAPDAVPAYTPWSFKDEAALADRPTVHTDIVIEYSSFNYRVTYKYHRELNQYFRLQGDGEHTTRTGEKIAAKNVAVLFLRTSLIPGDNQRLQMETTGEGRALIFRDGQRVEGTWSKASNRDRLQFRDSNGQLIELNRGVTWVSLVPTDRQVTF